MDSCNEKNQSTLNPQTQVFCFNWDLSNGRRNRFPGFTKNIFQHVGLLTFGTLYEYSDQGIIKTQIPPNEVPTSACFAGELVSCQELGKTSTAKEEFECWLKDQEDSVFDGAKYHIVRNNCVSFAIRACEKLKVEPSTDWINVAGFANYVPTKLASLLSSSRAKWSEVANVMSSNLKANENTTMEQVNTDNETNVHSDAQTNS